MRLNTYDREAFVRAVMDDVPTVDYQQQAKDYVYAVLAPRLPAKLKAVFDDKELRPSLDWKNWDLSCDVQGLSSVRWCHPFKLTPAERKHLDAIGEAAQAQSQSRSDLKVKVRATINSCTTLKQAKERLPEFEKYLPADRDGNGTASLPVVANLVADLTKAGWPKGKQVKATK